MRNANALKLAVGGLLLAAVVATLLLLPAEEYVRRLSRWAESIGPAGAFLIAALYVPACVLFIPGWILSVTTGYAFGVLWGTVAVSLGSVAGATAAMLIGRTLLREPLERRIAGNARFGALDRGVAENGFKIVLLTRLSPVLPFNLLNYAFGLTGVSLRNYVLASWIGMLPATIVYVYLGSAAGRLADVFTGDPSGGRGPRVLFWMGLVAAAVVTVLIGRIARRALGQSADSGTAGGPQEIGGRTDTATADSDSDQQAGVSHAR
jgi:uncharacterized membrane protein YdjX (TVP38/TMEM64 family)